MAFLVGVCCLVVSLFTRELTIWQWIGFATAVSVYGLVAYTESTPELRADISWFVNLILTQF